ncbi:Neuromedin-U receptor 2 [Holothuria leucospilota]|uniref:Neuromedin-U receptor 2 n=1 Tax=Holothuria leucospilota TaxID=206669 RepID=A0A9Q1H9A5_HOLLE|nr:Neuromedin-U receptor 2 [Holothuria leucospilota]
MSSQSEEFDIPSHGGSDEYSVSYYDYFTTGECTGFGWDLSNFTQDDSDFELILNSKATLVLTLFIQPIVAVFGILGNIAFMFIVWKEPHMRNNMNLILLNLAVADLLYLLLGVGEKFVNALNSPVLGDKLLFGKVGQCFIITPLLSVLSFTSLLLVSYLSVERCLAICKPMKHLRMNSRKRTFYYIGLIWLSSFVLTVSILPSYSDFFTVCIKWPNDATYSNYPAQAAFCQPQSSSVWIAIGEIVEIFPFFIALVLNVVCFYKIISKLYQRIPPLSVRDRSHEHNFVSAQHRHSAYAATRMLLINGIAFFILATPLHVTNVIQFAENVFRFTFPLTVFKELSVMLLYVNSAVNPYIYGVTNTSYRKAYQNLLCIRVWSTDSQVKSKTTSFGKDSSKSPDPIPMPHLQTVI